MQYFTVPMPVSLWLSSHSMSLLDELLLLQPRMLQALRCRRPYNRIVLKHGQQKVGELLGLHRVPVVLLHQHVH